MAGNCKPDISKLGKELVFKQDVIINSYVLSESTNPDGLFNGEVSSDWNTPKVAYLRDANNYIDVTFTKQCRLWRYPSTGYPQYSNAFYILKYVDENWIDVTSQLDQSKITDKSEWSVSINKIPKGRYKLCVNGLRMDSEWYVESLPTPYLIVNKSNIYIPNEDNYNSTNGVYVPISSIPSNIEDIEIDFPCASCDYLNGLRPIDKFTGDIQLIVTDPNSECLVSGIKSSKELVVATGDMNKELAQTINSMTVESVKTNNGNLKLAVSIDKGKTWKTHDGANWVDLSIIIPSTEYSAMTTNEKLQWNNARDVIASEGIDTNTFNSLNFNSLTDDNTAPGYLRFAYVLIRPTYTDDVKTTKLDWDFNAKGNMDLMVPGTEYSISLYEKEARFKSLIDNDLIKVNFLI